MIASFHAVCTSDDAGSEPAKAGDGIPEAIDSGRDRGVAFSAVDGADTAGAEAGAILDGRFRSSYKLATEGTEITEF